MESSRHKKRPAPLSTDVPNPKRAELMSDEPKSSSAKISHTFSMEEPSVRDLSQTSGSNAIEISHLDTGKPSRKRKKSKHTSHQSKIPKQLQLAGIDVSKTIVSHEHKRTATVASLNATSIEVAQRIHTYVCSMQLEWSQKKKNEFVGILNDIIRILSQILETQPCHILLNLSIDALYFSAIEQLCEQDSVFEDIQKKFISLRDKRRDILQQSNQEYLLPTLEELQSTMVPISLKKNITEGPFESVSQYLDIFVSLLREDFMYDMRKELEGIQQHASFVYEDVHLRCCVPVKSTYDSIFCTLKFGNIGRRIRWEVSKRLTYGNLLCLSEDNFHTIFFATIAERNVDDLKEQELTVSLIGKAAQDASFTSPSRKKVYKMFESPSYFEAYAPIMKHLESIKNNPEQLPFQKYLIQTNTEVEKPLYMRNLVTRLNLRGIICSCAYEECDHSSINVDDIQQMQQQDIIDLDQSQIEALCAALTRELVLIQGPPGTGKTYIGLKVVQSLLVNKPHAVSTKSPILVVCYTNHALDQFLEGLIEIKKHVLPSLEIRRLGGRSKSKVVEPYNIKNFFSKVCRDRHIRLYSQRKLIKIQRQLAALEDLLNGEFQPSRRTLELYSFILSKNIITELKLKCGITTTLPDLSGKGLVLTKAQGNPHYDEIEADRQVSFDEEAGGFELIYDQVSLDEFVRFFKRVDRLSKYRADQLLEGTDFIEPFPHFQLFKYCLYKLRDAWKLEAEKIAESDMDRENRERDRIRLKCLLEADVIGVTTTGAAKYNTVLTQVKSKICVIEEAAEVLEPHVISALTNHTQHLILIGDHKQLRPRTNSYEVGHKYKLEISLFERLARNHFPIVTLNVQHRMRPEIACLVSNNIYDGQLTNSQVVCNYDDVRGIQHNIFFVDHQHHEMEDDDFSKLNVHEANFIVSLSTYLLQNGYKPEEITILTPYTGQLFCIRNHEDLVKEIRVTTVDNYQGEENTIILLSMVRSNEEHRIGFIKDDNRVCVAISRAKVGFYCIGNFSMYRKHSELWKSIVKDLEQPGSERIGCELALKCINHKQITRVASAEDFKNVPEGGCDKICGIKLPGCSHVCKRKCHIDGHDSPCKEPCQRLCKRDLHMCRKICSEECSPCTEFIETVIPNCGHSQQVRCSVSPTDFSCKMKCDRILPVCEHPCMLTCGEDCNSKPCRMPVTKIWPCGHEAQKECYTTDFDLAYSFSCSSPCDATLACSHKCSGTCGKCSQGRLHVACKKRCERTLVCGHNCSAKCAKICPPCKEICPFKCPHQTCQHKCSTQCNPCEHPCEWVCEHHRCKRKCSEVCDRPRCNKPCKKRLKKCGHKCIGLCGEPCPDLCKICDKDLDIFVDPEKKSSSLFITLLDCGHIFEVTFLDKLLDDERSSIDWLRCPMCSTLIFTTYRYSKQIKKVQKNISSKKHHLFTEQERKSYSRTIPTMATDALETLQGLPNSHQYHLLRKWLTKVNTAELGRIGDVLLESTDILTWSVLEALHSLDRLSDENIYTNDEIIRNKITQLNAQTVQFLKWIESNLEYFPFANQMLDDLVSERRRITLLSKFYDYIVQNPSLHHSSAPDHLLIRQIKEYECFGNKPNKVAEDFFERACAFAELHASSL